MIARIAMAAVLAVFLAACATPARQEGEGQSPGRFARGSERDATQGVLAPEAVETEERRRARIRTELGASYFQQGNHAVALEELRQAITLDAGYAPAYGMLGLVHMALGDRVRADESFQRALRLAPEDADINNNYGWYLCQTGRVQEAMPRFMAATRDPLYSTPARPWHNAGICALRAGDEALAESHFQRAFQLDASNPVATFQLGELYLRRGDAVRARFYVQRLMRAWEPTAETLWLAHRVEKAAGDRDTAAVFAAQLRRRFPESPEAAALARTDG